ncbi:hypothetical protein GJ496_010469 [Pomphorhynchus laevis]|nr:hypothetical protein GJ496_010469 [Pomphorhynchus laevis]
MITRYLITCAILFVVFICGLERGEAHEKRLVDFRKRSYSHTLPRECLKNIAGVKEDDSDVSDNISQFVACKMVKWNSYVCKCTITVDERERIYLVSMKLSPIDYQTY